MIKYIVGLSLMAGLLLGACNKSTFVGSEILGDDFVDVSFTDTFTLNTLNIKADSARIYPSTNSLFLMGSVSDPVFGNSSTEFYTQIRKLFDIPDMENSVLDSVVLSIGINDNGLWGDTMADQTIEVYELGESLIDYDSIYSNQKFERGNLLGSTTLNPFTADTATVFYNGDTFYFPDIFRIRLDQSYGEMLLADTTSLQNDTLLQELTNGLVIKSTASTSATFGIKNGVFLDDYTNKVVLYFTKDDTLKMQHALVLGGKRGLFVENDRTNSMIETYLNNEEGSDTLLFLSAMQNSNIELTIPSLEGLDDKLINYAELEFYINFSVGHSPYDRVDQIYAYNVDADGNISYTQDLSIGLLQTATTYFDGTIEDIDTEDGSIVKKYNINFTSELKNRIKENDTETKVVLAPYLTTDRAYRSVLYGPGSSVFPAKLKITYTQQ